MKAFLALLVLYAAAAVADERATIVDPNVHVGTGTSIEGVDLQKLAQRIPSFLRGDGRFECGGFIRV